TAVICVGTDITAKHCVEDMLKEQKALATRSDRLRAMGEMASGMAHEFNQPLSIIRGAAENILIGKERGWPIDDAELITRMSRIVDQTVRLSDLIEHVRSLAKNADSDSYQCVGVQTVIDSALRLTRAQFAARGIDLTVEACAEELYIWGNPFSLEEVILALLHNARDAVEDLANGTDDRRVIVRTEEVKKGNSNWARITVTDTGPGIPEDILTRLFDPFFTTKGPNRGTGLGLSSAKVVVEAMGGGIEVADAPSGGAVSILRLPLYRNTREG
ncbi:MAG: sensor histidine kinase, partial [Planctomycetota bacterium]